MKKMLTSLSFLVLSLTVFGQAQESTLPQTKNAAAQMAAVKIDLPYAPQVVTEVIKQYVLVNGPANQRKAVGYRLSENTQLAKNNLNGADLHYFVQFKNADNPNETVLYLKLESYTLNHENMREAYYFNSEDAMDYLNQLKVAVSHNATVLQKQLQSSNLAKCKKRSDNLERQANRLGRQQELVALQVNKTQEIQKKDRQTQKLNALNDKVNTNKILLANQKDETLRQATALTLLANPIKH